jgi:pimeloyl-ACP methyl ester carboxylesterase
VRRQYGCLRTFYQPTIQTGRIELPTHEYLCNVDCPVYLIHGTADQKICFHSSEKLEELGSELGKNISSHVVPNGEHNLRSASAFGTLLEEIVEKISGNDNP